MDEIVLTCPHLAEEDTATSCLTAKALCKLRLPHQSPEHSSALGSLETGVGEMAETGLTEQLERSRFHP